MKKMKYFPIIKVLAIVLLIVSVLVGSFGMSGLGQLVSSGYGWVYKYSLHKSSGYEDTEIYRDVLDYYVDSMDKYLEIRKLLGVGMEGGSDEAFRKRVLLHQVYTPREYEKGITINDFLKDMESGTNVISLLEQEREEITEGSQYRNLESDIAASCIEEWKKIENCSFIIDNQVYLTDGGEEQQKAGHELKMRKGEKYIANRVKNLVRCYYFYENMFETEDLNLQYRVLDYGEKDRYILEEGRRSYSSFVESYSGHKDYWFAVYDSKSGVIPLNESAIPGLRAERLQRLSASIPSGGNKSRAFALALKKDFAKKDIFKTTKDIYVARGKQMEKYLEMLLRAVCTAALCFFFLLYACGRMEEIEENGKKKYKTVLYGIDKALTEFFAAGMAAAVILFVFSLEYHVEYNAYRGRLGLYGMTVVFAVELLLFFSCFFVLVKKCKAGRVFKDTLFGTLYKTVKRKDSLIRRLWVRLKKKMQENKKLWRDFSEDKKGIPRIAAFVLGQFCFNVVFIQGLYILENWWDAGTGFVICLFAVIGEILILWRFIKWLLASRLADRKILEGTKIIAGGNLEYKLEKGENEAKIREEMIDAINHIGEGLSHAVAEQVRSERMKTELITNVSHDIKTPLTSVINYVDLLKREELGNEKAVEYLEVLDNKSQRLKVLIEDLVEASKASSGALSLELQRLNVKELVIQTNGEFAERFEQKRLTLMNNISEEVLVMEGDSRRTFRILENLYQNVAKYAMEGTRVYVDLRREGQDIVFQIKNISKEPLKVSADELTERFVRGEESRTTEGSGLGLSIAKSITELQKGKFEIYTDGDLFCVTVRFPQFSAEIA